MAGSAGSTSKSLGIPERDAYVECYFSSRRTPEDQRLAPFHTAFALFRMAVIFEGIAARARTGTASADSAAEVGGLSAIFARRAVERLPDTN